MIFKHFIWEYGFSFAPLDKAIAQDCEVLDRNQLLYIFHSPTCNINQNIKSEEEVIDKDICTCGLQTNTKKSDTVGNGQNHPTKNPQTQLMTLLQKLMNNQNKDEMNEEFKGRNIQHGQ